MNLELFIYIFQFCFLKSIHCQRLLAFYPNIVGKTVISYLHQYLLLFKTIFSFLIPGLCWFRHEQKFAKMARYDMTGIGINLREIPDESGTVRLKVLGLLLDGPAHSAGVRQVGALSFGRLILIQNIVKVRVQCRVGDSLQN